MTTHTKNIERAYWAEVSLDAFMDIVGDSGDQQTNLGDLLGNIMHWCAINDVDFDAALTSGRGHFEYESADDYEGD